jgi:hypothetical protein
VLNVIGPGTFLCGCDPEQKKNYFFAIRQTPMGEAITNKRYDDQGFEVCPEHGARFYGWASPQVQGPQGNLVSDFSKMGSNESISLTPSAVEDRRPCTLEKAAAEILASRRARKNGAPKDG